MAFWNGVKRFFGETGKVLKRAGSIGYNALKQYHQPLSMALHGLAETSGNPTLKTLAGYGLMASAGATGMGWGKDHGLHSKPLPKY